MSAKNWFLAQQDELPVDLQIELASYMDENIIIALFNKDHIPIEVARNGRLHFKEKYLI